jgi:hypothetical protein
LSHNVGKKNWAQGALYLFIQRDQQGLKLLAANDSKIFPKYENFLGVSVGTRCKL